MNEKNIPENLSALSNEPLNTQLHLKLQIKKLKQK
jgi:hypothetical protein